MMRVAYAALASVCMAFAGPSRADSNSKLDCTSTRNSGAGPVVIKTTLGETPALVRIPAEITRTPIVLWHGFGPPDSEQALMEALPLDEVPAVKVYLGLPLFGSRTPQGGAKEVMRRQQEDLATLLFEPAVMGAAKELPAVVRALEEHGCMKRNQPIGLFGFSAGGAAVLYALAERDVRIGAAVTLNASTGLTASVNAYERATKGSYKWTDEARRLAQRSDAAGRAKDIAKGNPAPALLIIHGSDEAVVTPEVARTLHQALVPAYRERLAESSLQLMLVPGLAHGWTSPGSLEALRGSIGAWFDKRQWPAGSTR